MVSFKNKLIASLEILIFLNERGAVQILNTSVSHLGMEEVNGKQTLKYYFDGMAFFAVLQ